MSTTIKVTIQGKQYDALPPSFKFQREHKEAFAKLMKNELEPEEAQQFNAAYVTHCIQRATPGLDVAALEEQLDAVSIAEACVQIGTETQRQIARAYGVESLGEPKAGEA